jgi:hypothetical protein
MCTSAEAPGRTVTLIEEPDAITVWHANDFAAADSHKSSRDACMVVTCACLLQWGAAYRLTGTPEEQQETLKV